MPTFKQVGAGFDRRALIASTAVGLAALPTAGSLAQADQRVDPQALKRFTLNIDMWWLDRPFLDRIDAAARAGFQTVEMWELSATGDRTAKAVKRRCGDAGVKPIHALVDAVSFAEKPLSDSQDAVKRSLEDLEALGVRYATILGHEVAKDLTKAEMLTRYYAVLEAIAPLFEAAQIVGVVEPFNRYDHPGWFLYGSGDALMLTRQLANPWIKINWDLFHMQRAEGNLITELEKGMDQCALIQIADSPARRQPGTGEINYGPVLKAVLAAGFDGPIGLECEPGNGNEDQAIADVAQLGLALQRP